MFYLQRILKGKKPHIILIIMICIMLMVCLYYGPYVYWLFVQRHTSNGILISRVRSNISLKDKQLLLLNSPSRSYLHPKVEGYLKQHKVFISLTTSPKRIKHLEEVFSTLDLRNVEAILLALPKVFARTGEHYKVPESLVKAYPKLRILHVAKDLGPITKLLPAVEYAKKIDPQATVITIDDDILYPFGMINEMIHYLVLSNGVVGAEMYNIGTVEVAKIDRQGYPWKTLDRNIHMLGLDKRQFVAGYGGLAYRVDWLDINKLVTLSQLNTNCFRSDDMVISYVLNEHNIPMSQIATNYYNMDLVFLMNYSFSEDALCMIQTHKDAYLSCYQSMLKYDHRNNLENIGKK